MMLRYIWLCMGMLFSIVFVVSVGGGGVEYEVRLGLVGVLGLFGMVFLIVCLRVWIELR